MPVITFSRRDTSNSGPLNPIYIAGFCVVGAIVLGLAFWGLIRMQRKRSAKKREAERGAAFLSVRGIVKADTEEKHPENMMGAYSRDLNNGSVVLPEKVLARPPKMRNEVLDFHRQSGTFPQAFTPKPFSFAMSAGSGSPNSLSPQTFNRTSFRTSYMSSSTNMSRFSVMSTNSPADTGSTTGTSRKVRQLFDPVLPDELLIARVGEHLTVVQSFDDGWCLIGRENSTFVSTAKSLFKQNVAPDAEVELGVVPAWCFIKPAPGLRAERPVRSSSLGITVQMSGPSFSSRDELTSWSNF